LPKPHRAKVKKAPGGSALLFAALGDPTRLQLVSRLADGAPLSITSLTAGTRVTRQAITKHLRVLEEAGVLRGTRRGRERLWRIERQGLRQARRYLELISSQWDDALSRLQKLVEQ